MLTDAVGFELIGSELGADVKSALKTTLAGGVVFPKGTDPLSIFREVLAASIRDIELHPRGKLFQEFLSKGPYEDIGTIPENLVGERLSDAETASAIKFIFSYMVNHFKGAITELLASRTCLHLIKQLKKDGNLPSSARLFIGDSVGVFRAKGKGLLKGADMHILLEDSGPGVDSSITVAGVVEVKSYFRSAILLGDQLNRHLQRTRQGLRVGDVDYPEGKVNIGCGNNRVVRIAVLPSDWKLPRTFRFEDSPNGHLLFVDQGRPPCKEDEIIRTAEDEWTIKLRWSKEALASAAYEMTFWYMEKVGEVIYGHNRPKGWEQMSPAEAGRNAVKMMLYYAILRCRSNQVKKYAIALYNCYGFGYALGMNFKNAERKREMLWYEDLDEILSEGITRNGCRIY